MTFSWVLTPPEHNFLRIILLDMVNFLNFCLQHQEENVSGGPYSLGGNQALM